MVISFLERQEASSLSAQPQYSALHTDVGVAGLTRPLVVVVEMAGIVLPD